MNPPSGNDSHPERSRPFPTPDQELLLAACLLKGDAALAAFEQWPCRDDLDSVDAGSYRLLPLLYRNVRGLEVQAPILERLKGVHRRTWYKNQLLFRRTAGAVGALKEARIDTLVHKGAVLAVQWYDDVGARPMADVDVLVPTACAVDAFEVLEGLGWRSPSRNLHHLLRACAGVDLVSNDGFRLDLHWHLLSECLEPDADAEFWERSLPIEFSGVDTRTLEPADQLLQVLAHGCSWNAMAPLRWVADSVILVEGAASQLDWSRLVEQGRRRRLTCVLHHMLGYLHRRWRVPVPHEVLDELKRLPVASWEGREFWFRQRTGPDTLWGIVPLQWYRYRRLTSGTGGRSHVFGFARFLQWSAGLESLWQVPSFVASKLIRRLWLFAVYWERRLVGSVSGS